MQWKRLLLLLVCCCYRTLAGGGAPDPYPSIHGGTSGSPPAASPDPLAGYYWDNISALADRFQYQVYYDAPVAADSTEKAAFDGLETLLNNTGRADVTVRGDGTIRLKFAAEGASWLEFDSDDLAEVMRNNGVTVQMSISENRLRAPSESGKLKQYNSTFRLELNNDLYEGVRYAFLTVGGMQHSATSWHISALRRVSQAVPANYEGSFSSSDRYLDRLWYVGAFTTRATFVSSGKEAYLGSILMNRGDRIAFLGDAHVAQATALAAFGTSVYPLLVNSNLYCSTVGNTIEPYWLTWVLSILDYNDATNDTAAFHTMVPLVEKWLARARDVVYPHALNKSASLRWSRDDERMGFGFEFPDVANAQCAYRGLMTECVTRYGKALAAAGNASSGRAWTLLGEQYTRDFGHNWWEQCGMHGSADAINAGIVAKGDSSAAAIKAHWFADPLQLASLSPFESFFVLRALLKLDLDDEALFLVHRQWGGMIAAGATMTWERFDPVFADAGAIRASNSDDAPVNSMNDRTSMAHPWSSAATALLSRFALGVEATTAGFATWEARPRFLRGIGCGESPHRLQWVRGDVPTPHGTVSIAARTDLVPSNTISNVSSMLRTAVVLSVPNHTRGTFVLPVLSCSEGKPYTARIFERSGMYHSQKLIEADRLCNPTQATGASGASLLHQWSGKATVDGIKSLELKPGHYTVCVEISVPPTVVTGSPIPTPHRWDASHRNFSYPVKYYGTDRSTNGAWRGIFGTAGYHLFNISNGLDHSSLPTAVQAVWASCREDTQGGAPYAGRVACRPDGPFSLDIPRSEPAHTVRAPSGRNFGSCAFVGFNTSDARVPQLPQTSSETDQAKVTVASISAVGWKGSFHVDVKLTEAAEAAGRPYNVSLYFADFAHWGTRQVVKVTDLASQNTVAQTVLVEDFASTGVYLTYKSCTSLRFRVHQVHSDEGDREGWAPPPLLTAIFFD